MEFNQEIVKSLKCCECDLYLSCAPIYIKPNGSCVCGRCPIPEEPEELLIRMLPYEKLAETTLFPCQYDKNGCNKLIPFKDVKCHEIECDYRNFMCLVLPSGMCEWLGPRTELLNHCKTNHSEQVVSNPFTISHDIKSDSFKTYITNIDKALFVIHTKVCLSERKIYHRVRYIGDGEKAKEYRYTLDIERNGERLAKKGIVSALGCMMIQQDSSVVTGINSLLEFLGGFDGVTFTITIESPIKQNVEKLIHSLEELNFSRFLSQPCSSRSSAVFNTNCNVPLPKKKRANRKKTKTTKEPETVTKDHVLKSLPLGNKCSLCNNVVSCFVYRTTKNKGFCAKCTPPKRFCVFRSMGCRFFDVEPRVVQHENNFCAFQDYCWLCESNLNQCPRSKHMQRNHKDDIYSNYSRVPLELEHSTTYHLLINTVIGEIYCACAMFNKKLEFDIYSVLPSDELYKYNCVLTIINPLTNYSIREVLDLRFNDGKDWYFRITGNNVNKILDGNDFDVTINIERILE